MKSARTTETNSQICCALQCIHSAWNCYSLSGAGECCCYWNGEVLGRECGCQGHFCDLLDTSEKSTKGGVLVARVWQHNKSVHEIHSQAQLSVHIPFSDGRLLTCKTFILAKVTQTFSVPIAKANFCPLSDIGFLGRHSSRQYHTANKRGAGTLLKTML